MSEIISPSSLAPLLQCIQLSNFLSFGPDASDIRLQPLNILIGPNGVGKSNFIEALSLLRAYPINDGGRSDSGLQSVIRRGGGAQAWIWQGKPTLPGVLRVDVDYPAGKGPLHHGLFFTSQLEAFHLQHEYIEDVITDNGKDPPYFYYQYSEGEPAIRVTGEATPRQLNRDNVEPNVSILAQRNDPDLYPEITFLAKQYSQIAIYREWTFGRSSTIRGPQRADGRVDRLEEDFSNLGLFLNRISGIPRVRRELRTHLSDIYSGVDDFHVNIFANNVQIFFIEGDFRIPSTRLSDGTLRYLCLLAILLDPAPPPLICIEEPELGLHPDILPKIADLLLEASTRTQLIVTTHSDIIVDAMTPTPECVLVCEKHEGQTQIKRLSADDLTIWRDKYRLGELWTRGEIGGTRW